MDHLQKFAFIAISALNMFCIRRTRGRHKRLCQVSNFQRQECRGKSKVVSYSLMGGKITWVVSCSCALRKKNWGRIMNAFLMYPKTLGMQHGSGRKHVTVLHPYHYQLLTVPVSLRLTLVYHYSLPHAHILEILIINPLGISLERCITSLQNNLELYLCRNGF